MRQQGIADRLLREIYSVMNPKLFNIEHGTAKERERQIIKECSAYISMLKYSVLSPKLIREIWDRDPIKFM